MTKKNNLQFHPTGILKYRVKATRNHPTSPIWQVLLQTKALQHALYIFTYQDDLPPTPRPRNRQVSSQPHSTKSNISHTQLRHNPQQPVSSLSNTGNETGSTGEQSPDRTKAKSLAKLAHFGSTIFVLSVSPKQV